MTKQKKNSKVGKKKGWTKEPRRHALARMGIKTTLPDGRKLRVDKFIANGNYPDAIDAEMVGKYPLLTGSGGGYLYDDVLEYRVWVHPHRYNEDGDDYAVAFDTYKEAEEYSNQQVGAEPPLVLIRQKNWIGPDESGNQVIKSGERITEWQPDWLFRDNKNTKKNQQKYLKIAKEQALWK